MAFIEVIHLHKKYELESNSLEVLRDIHFNIEAGESLAILGASGSGKSTLLHLLGALDKPSQGEILFEGKSLFQGTEAELSHFRNRILGFVFQFHHLLPMLTALENVMLPAMIAGENKKQSKEKAQSLLARVGLAERFKHKPSELSGGEQQRVAIARSLILEPKLLLADEPTGNVDSRQGEELAELLLELKQSHQMTLVIVTHNENLAKHLSRRVVLSDGRLADYP